MSARSAEYAGVEHHDFMCEANFFADSPYVVLPECSCGWEGRGVATTEDAQEAWENHCDALFMEATQRCCRGECCGPGSWCCTHAGPHDHADKRAHSVSSEGAD